MKLNTTTQYAIRFLHEISKVDELSSIKALSTKLDIPYKYTSAIVTSLVKAGLVESTRGRNGGIRLAKSEENIRLSDILDALNEPYVNDECILGEGKCKSVGHCSLHMSWLEPKRLISDMFRNTSLKSLN